MGGEGAMGYANESLKYNRSQIKRESYFDKIKGSFAKIGKKKFEFRELNKAELLAIRQKAVEIENRRKLNTKIAIGITMFILVLTMYLLFKIF